MDIFHFFEINRYVNDTLMPNKELKQIVLDLIGNKKISLDEDQKRIIVKKLFSSHLCMDVWIYLSRKVSGNYFFVVKCEADNYYMNFSDELSTEEIIKITEGGIQNV